MYLVSCRQLFPLSTPANTGADQVHPSHTYAGLPSITSRLQLQTQTLSENFNSFHHNLNLTVKPQHQALLIWKLIYKLNKKMFNQ